MSLTIRDIALLSGVSKSTISRYLNGGSVSQATTQKIQQVIQQTGYESNLFASSLKRKKTGLIGVMFKGIQSVSVGHLLETIDYHLKVNQRHPLLMIENTLLTEADPANDLLALANQGVDGIIFGTDHLTKAHEQALQKIDIPVIAVGQKSSFCAYRRFDNVQAGYIVGEYIQRLGHRRIAFIGPDDTDEEVGKARKEGVLSSFTAQDPLLDFSFIPAYYSFEAGYQAARTLLQRQPTIAVCATDRIAMGVMQFLNERQIKIPDQISVIGFGNYEFSNVVHPPLSSLAFDYDTLAQQVVEELLLLIDGHTIPVQEPIGMHLVSRKSVKQNV